MALFNFNTPKSKKFHYQPRYFDERKERLEKMKAHAKAEIAAEKGEVHYTSLQKGFLSQARKRSKLKGVELKAASNTQVLIFLLILVFILGIFYVLSPEMFKAFWRIK